jgi:hypothetical protein
MSRVGTRRGVPRSGRVTEVIATNEGFENFIEDDDGWFSDLELKVLDLEKEISEWRESRTRELAEPARRRKRERDVAAEYPRGRDYGQSSAGRARPGLAPISEDEWRRASDRTQVLIDRGRRTARPPRSRRDRGRRKTRPERSRRRRRIVVGSAAGLVALAIGAMIVLRAGPSWPRSVATVQSEITTACQNPNVVSEPSQVDFACGKDTSQILWVFALLTSDNNPGYADAKSGRKGLEPITPTQGGEIAWSLNLHHPYNPANPVDSLEVAARAINNIIGGATLTSANGNPAVQPGLESKPENCARYTGSPAITSDAGFPSLCASPVTTTEGQAALVADVYQQWMPGATPVAAQNASVLFENAGDPGDPQVQAILKTLPSPAK